MASILVPILLLALCALVVAVADSGGGATDRAQAIQRGETHAVRKRHGPGA